MTMPGSLGFASEYGHENLPGQIAPARSVSAYLSQYSVVPSEGIEPPTFWFEARRSIH